MSNMQPWDFWTLTGRHKFPFHIQTRANWQQKRKLWSLYDFVCECGCLLVGWTDCVGWDKGNVSILTNGSSCGSSFGKLLFQLNISLSGWDFIHEPSDLKMVHFAKYKYNIKVRNDIEWIHLSILKSLLIADSYLYLLQFNKSKAIYVMFNSRNK